MTTPNEIERKFLVDEVPEDLDIDSREEIAQGYLATGDHQVRLRRQGDRPLLTAKRGHGLVRDEVEVPLEEESFEKLWPLTEGRRLKKERLTATVDGRTVTVDVYRGPLAGLIVVEAEFEDLDAARAFSPPQWFVRELTDDASYSNQRLALEGLPVEEEYDRPMASPTKAKTEPKTKPLIDDELEQLFSLIKGADSVELKLTVPEVDHRSTVTQLGMDPLEAELRQVFFFDTPSLALNEQGVVVRARRIQGKGGDSVVKLRPVVPSELPADLRNSPNLGVEVDAMPGGYVCSASLKTACGNDDVQTVARGERPLRKLFSKEQRKFFAAHAPEGLELDELTLLGPILVLKLKFRPADYDRKLVAELWSYPDNSRILELSTKCAPEEAFQVSLDSKAFLRDRGVELSGEQQTKTKTALEYFSKNLSAPAS